jgi:hypothetical protein
MGLRPYQTDALNKRINFDAHKDRRSISLPQEAFPMTTGQDIRQRRVWTCDCRSRFA